MVNVKRTIKVVTEQAILPNRTPEVEGYPLRLWAIDIRLLDDAGNEMKADVFSKVTYNLHPTFPDPVQTYNTPPFRCQNEGWGEFDLTIDLFVAEKGGKHSITHDLNFAQPNYEAKHVITFKDPSPALLDLLRKSGPVPDDVNGRKAADAKKKRKSGANVDMDKLADMLTRLQEDDLLQVIQMIHDNKTDETYTKNDIDRKYSLSQSPTKSPTRRSTRSMTKSPTKPPPARVSMSPFTLDSGPVRKPSIRLIVKPTNEELAAGVVPPPPRTWPLLPTASQKAQLKKEEAELRKLAKEIEQEKSIEAGIETGNYSYSSDTDSISLDGEFHVDLYTLPDHLVQMLWSFVTQLN